MYVIREVLNCKPGKVRQMLDKFREILRRSGQGKGEGQRRLLSDSEFEWNRTRAGKS
jgi:hypothetical protein